MKTKLASPHVLTLMFINFLERSSYYGVRAVLVLQAVDESGLNMDRTQVYAYYGWLMAFMGIAPFFAGLLTDFTFKQRKAVLIGGGMALLGYLMLLSTDSSIFFAGAVIAILGTSLVRPNLIVLVGRLYDKADRSRSFAFLLFYLATSLGGGAIALMGYWGEIEGYTFGFKLAAAITFGYLLLFWLIKDRLVFKEFEEYSMQVIEENTSDRILDLPMDFQQPGEASPPRHTFPIISILLLYAVLFWQTYSVANADFMDTLISEAGDVIPAGTIYLLNTYVLIGVIVIILIWWSIRTPGSSLRNLVIAAFCLAICSGIVYGLVYIPKELLLPLSFLPYILFAIAEILCSATIFAYLTRISTIRYSSTIIGLYFLVIYLSQALSGLFSAFVEIEALLLICTFVILLLGVFFLAFKSTLLRWAGGLD